MDQNTLAQQKDKLLEQKDKLIAQLSEMTGDKSFNKDKVQAKWKEVGDKEEDNAVEVATYQDNISVERSLEETLEKIEKAINKIDQGKYEVCDKCSGAIEESRLIAHPQAGKCLKCASEK